MGRRFARLLFLTAILLAPLQSPASPLPVEPCPNYRYWMEIEGYGLWQGLNDAAVPGDAGTRFSLSDIASSPKAGSRIEAGVRFPGRHELRGVLAPLTISGKGDLARPVFFKDRIFGSGSETEAVYRFNSYRLTYRYLVFPLSEWGIAFGFTAKIRDAMIQLTQNGTARRLKNVGFVPLLHLSVARRLTPELSAEIEADALAAPQGRAEDASARLRYCWSPGRFSAALGYRILEGGADNDKVYTFALFHFATLSISFVL